MKYNLEFLFDLVKRQLTSFFPLSSAEEKVIKDILPAVMDKAVKCYANVDNKYFHKDGEVYFSPFHSGQYLIFLYYLSHVISCELKILTFGGGELQNLSRQDLLS